MTNPLAAALDFALTSFNTSPTSVDERREPSLGWPYDLETSRTPAYKAALADEDAGASHDRAARRAARLARKGAAR